jgi:DNA-binding GntR family transcriptional regulator
MTTKAESVGVPGAGEITRLLEEMREGDPEAAEELLSQVYRQLRTLATDVLLLTVDGPQRTF